MTDYRLKLIEERLLEHENEAKAALERIRTITAAEGSEFIDTDGQSYLKFPFAAGCAEGTFLHLASAIQVTYDLVQTLKEGEVNEA